MPRLMAPHLVELDGEKACSTCKTVFEATADISLSRAFANHVRDEHKPPQVSPKPTKAATQN